MQAQSGSTTGVKQRTGSNAGGIQSNGPFRQRKRVPTMALISTSAAERVSDNTLLRWHRE